MKTTKGLLPEDLSESALDACWRQKARPTPRRLNLILTLVSALAWSGTETKAVLAYLGPSRGAQATAVATSHSWNPTDGSREYQDRPPDQYEDHSYFGTCTIDLAAQASVPGASAGARATQNSTLTASGNHVIGAQMGSADGITVEANGSASVVGDAWASGDVYSSGAGNVAWSGIFLGISVNEPTPYVLKGTASHLPAEPSGFWSASGYARLTRNNNGTLETVAQIGFDGNVTYPDVGAFRGTLTEGSYYLEIYCLVTAPATYYQYDESGSCPHAQADSSFSVVFKAGVDCSEPGPAPVNHWPVANAGSDQAVECQGAATPVLLDGSGSTDPDGDILSYSWSESGTLLGVGSNLMVHFGMGTHTVTLTVTDPGGLSAQSTTTVTVQDTTPPAITCPAHIDLPCGADPLVPVSFAATASDHCDAAPTILYSQQPGSGFPVGTTTVACLARDASGNTSECSFTVTRAALGFSGFLPPLGGADVTGGSLTQPLRTFKSGSTIPVKFTTTCDETPVLTGIHRLQVTRCDEAAVVHSPLEARARDAVTIGDQFRLADGQWLFDLDTTATRMSPGIWRLTATLSDGSQHSACIQLK